MCQKNVYYLSKHGFENLNLHSDFKKASEEKEKKNSANTVLNSESKFLIMSQIDALLDKVTK